MAKMSPSDGRSSPLRRLKDAFWPVVGLGAVVLSFWLLWQELAGVSVSDVTARLQNIPLQSYLLAGASTLVAYGALAWYDRIALIHLGIRHISWLFISLCSFTTYALSHNIGASVFSGGVVRYRAYTAKGLSPTEVAVLVAVCSLTFLLGTVLLAGFVLVLEPDQLARLAGLLPPLLTRPETARLIGFALLGFIALYLAGSMLRLRPLRFGSFTLEYPRPAVTIRQMFAAPLELLGAAGIIYFALPDAGNPGYFVVLAVFLASFSAGLVSHAPGGLGVFEIVFLTAMPELAKVDVLAALLVFRLLYLLIPLALSVPVVLLFEKGQFDRRRREAAEAPPSR